MITAKVVPLKNLRALELTLTSELQGNALGLAEAKELAQHLSHLKADALLFKNEGDRFFCTGGNLKEQKKSTKAASTKTQKVIRQNLQFIAELSIPTAAVVTGDAFGGGVELLSAFDRVFVTPHIQLGIWQRRLGVTFGWGGGKRLLGRLGEKKLSQAFLAAKVYNAFEAEKIGLVDEIAPMDLVEEKANQWLYRAARLPTASLKKFRKWTPQSEAKIFESLWYQKDHLVTIRDF